MSKKIFILPLLFSLFISVSCANTEKEQLLASVLETLNLPSEKLILANKEQFLADMDTVLAADKDYLLTLVDKQHYLSKDYVPEDLVPPP